MKIALLLAGACGMAVLVGVLLVLFRSPSGGVASSPGASRTAETAGEEAKLLPVGEGERAAPKSDAAVIPPEPAAASPSQLAPAPQPIPLAGSDQSLTTPVGHDAAQQGDPDGFEAKYPGLDESGFKQALEQLEAVLAQEREGRVADKSQLLPPEAIAALERECAWLKARAYP